MPPDLEPYRRAAARWFYRKADLVAPDATLADLARERTAYAASIQTAVAEEAARALGLVRCEAVPVDGGTLHAVFRLTAGEDAWYARTSLPSITGPAGELVVDALASSAAAAAGVPVARVRHVDLGRERVSFDLEIVDAAAGDALDVQHDAALAALGAVLARLHRVPGDAWGPLDPAATGGPTGLRPTWNAYVLSNLDAHLVACRRDETLASDEVDDIRALFREAAPLLETAPGRLCHGDLARPNVLTAGATVTALVDWEDALVADPLFDIAGWGTFVGHHDRRAPLLAGYAAGASLPADAELRYWLYFVRIMLAKTVHRRRFGWTPSDRIPAADRIRPAVTALRAELGRGT